MRYILNLIKHNKIFGKASWCLQHFLTMEFYRKICNNCYWSNLYNPRNSLLKQTLLISISFISLLFMSFFYLPTDPANSNKTSYYVKIINFILSFKISIGYILNSISNQAIRFSSSIINLLQFIFAPSDLIRLKSSLLIWSKSFTGAQLLPKHLKSVDYKTNWSGLCLQILRTCF